MQGESLQTVYLDIVRLMALAYPGPQTDIADVVAKDAFIDSLEDKSMKMRILDREPKNLDEAFRYACKLEALEDRFDDKEKIKKDRMVRTLDSGVMSSQESNAEILRQLSAIQKQLAEQRLEFDQFKSVNKCHSQTIIIIIILN